MLWFVQEVILDYVEENSQQIGGKDCIVEIDESKFGKENITKAVLLKGNGFWVEWKEVQIQLKKKRLRHLKLEKPFSVTPFLDSGISPEQLVVGSLLEHECVPL
ncbi:hypothetical protein TNCV_4390421 [Trichonephila clavipes]|nr:hypothetical protein TNCV_4390421 [Trichonephila clavipes]